jgi:oligopeptide/dipeptide ABC transporter ATP-binding protein
MYLGKIVEAGPVEAIFQRPGHPYTLALLAATPVPNPSRRRATRAPLQGDIPSPANPPPGCRFHTRCPLAQDVCRRGVPPMVSFPDGLASACHFAETVRQSPPAEPAELGP